MRKFMRSTVEDGKLVWEEILVMNVKRGDKIKVITEIEEKNRVEIMYFEALRGYNKRKCELDKLRPLIPKPIVGKLHRD